MWCFLSWLVSLACLVRVRAPSQARETTKKENTASIRSRDDSGSKLRDKEQQRLSSK